MVIRSFYVFLGATTGCADFRDPTKLKLDAISLVPDQRHARTKPARSLEINGTILDY
ncbi:MAG: hypothetical protein KUG80_04875 [Gammaproteobacteria bacterium]|nr:hypothetical protein [Gammaproteobacteria bacterium]